MPIRLTRARKEEGLKKFIPQLYQDPTLRYFSYGQEWEGICDLIYGPSDLHTDKFFNEDVRQRGYKKLKELRKLWRELGDDILKAQQQYQPGKKPWGSRFKILKVKRSKN